MIDKNVYLRARYYNPRIGQFVQIDTYRGTQEDITSQNRYTYCLNNQYKYTDPSGHKSVFSALRDIVNIINKTVEKVASIKPSKPIPPKKTTLNNAVNKIQSIIVDTAKLIKNLVDGLKKVPIKEPEPCPSEKVIDDTINAEFNKLQKDYLNYYDDSGAQGAIKKAIKKLRNESLKKQDIEYARQVCKESRRSLRVPSFTSDLGVKYLADSYFCLENKLISSAFVFDCIVAGSISFIMNVTEKSIKNSMGIRVTMIQIDLPYFDFNKMSILKPITNFSLMLVEIQFDIIRAFGTIAVLTIGSGIGIAYEEGYNFDMSTGGFSFYYRYGIVITSFYRLTLNLRKAIVDG